jgi:BMFP domain-containing protein YqiC
MQTENGFMDQVARLMTNAAGAAKGVRDEIATMARSRAEKFANDLELVPREEFEAVKTMLHKARAEIESLKTQMASLNQAETTHPKRSHAPRLTPAPRPNRPKRLHKNRFRQR